MLTPYDGISRSTFPNFLLEFPNYIRLFPNISYSSHNWVLLLKNFPIATITGSTLSLDFA